MHYFITGHTGFKGSWLISLLKTRGDLVTGFALPAIPGSLFEVAGLQSDLDVHHEEDIRNLDNLKLALVQAQPDVVIHFAAQPLVLRSYEDPLETFTTNVNGTLNLLEAMNSLDKSVVVLIVTTDKVYKDTGTGNFSEEDPLGGHDPYSASKAMADLLAQSWAVTTKKHTVLTARAGNVIGAFDTAKDRLIPDANRAIHSRTPLLIRNPEAVRPWQHVLDCLHGYLLYVESAINHETPPPVLNFGPEGSHMTEVRKIVDLIRDIHPTLAIHTVDNSEFKETLVLTLDASLARVKLGWHSKIPLNEAVQMSIRTDSENVRAALYSDVKAFLGRF